MDKCDSQLRVHPAIGFARVGNSEDYYLGPETAAGMPLEGVEYTGGIPLNAETLEPIKSSEIRDSKGGLKRQAARFKVYRYPHDSAETYPSEAGTEVTIGDTVDGKVVADIVWTVHVANKKANAFLLENPDIGDRDLLIHGYENGNLPPVRNLRVLGGGSVNPNDIERLRKLVIDPGPRTIRGRKNDVARFDKCQLASYYDEKTYGIRTISDYPKTFPDDSFPGRMYNPWGEIDTLGELRTDGQGRLIVTGGYGRASSILRSAASLDPPEGVQPPLEPYPLTEPVDNDGWFDDTSDGPVNATLIFEDGSTAPVHGAWVNTTDPAFAPQTLNAVSLWDDIFDTWVRKLDLVPSMWKDGEYNPRYRPAFPDYVQPFFVAAATQRWNTNLPSFAIAAHQTVGNISAKDKPEETIMAGLSFVRNPNLDSQSYQGAPFMPLSLGDNGKSFLSPSLTQYFLLSQWDAGLFEEEAQKMGDGERLDRDVLMNCLGGRFSPGIDMTFIVRQPDIYIQNWRELGCGPFRIRPAELDYCQVKSDRPFLGVGYVPLHTDDGLQPGDCSKFMSAPWHTDYNSCATHNTAPNPPDNSQKARSTLYWSWPAQRPVAVYTADDAADGILDRQRYSVRGTGTGTDDPGEQGRFQEYIDHLLHWPEVGVIIQATQIDDVDGEFQNDWYLEVHSQFNDDNSEVEAWPINSSTASKN